MIPLDLLRGRSFRLSVIASVCCFTAQAAGLVALPFLLQYRLRLAPLVTGLCITAWPLSVAGAAIVTGRLADRVSTPWLCTLGGACLSVGLAGCGLWPAGSDAAALVPFIALSGVGFGVFQSPSNRNMFMAAPPERSGAAGGVQGAARVWGQTLGALTIAVLLGLAPIDTALAIGFGGAALMALAAGAVSFARSSA